MTPILYMGAVVLPIMALCIVLALKGASVKFAADTISIGFYKYSTMEYTFSAKKIWVRPIKRSTNFRCVVQVVVFQGGRPIRTHLIKMPNETAADVLIAKFETPATYNNVIFK